MSVESDVHILYYYDFPQVQASVAYSKQALYIIINDEGAKVYTLRVGFISILAL